MNLSKDAEKMINESLHQKELNDLLETTDHLLGESQISPTELQWTVLINHLNEMLKRGSAGEKIPAVDPEMFQEVSTTAIEIAEKLVAKIGNLPIDEVFILSIHFESAKNN